MDMGPRKLMTLLLFCCGCLANVERIPYFKSTNFQNVLHWDKVDSLGEEVRYSVGYKRYGEQKFKPKLECQNIAALYCDLTAETPPEYSVQYIGNVSASIGQFLSPTLRFYPLRDTNLGAPTVIVTPTTSSINVTVTLPLGPNNITSVEEIFKLSKWFTNSTTAHFILNITDPSWAAQVHKSQNKDFVIENLRNNNTEYCGYVVYIIAIEVNRQRSEKQTFCVTLPGNPWLLYTWFLLSGSFLLCSLLLPLSLCLCYVKKTSNIPEALKWKKFDFSPSSWHCPEAVTISNVKPDPVDICQSVSSGSGLCMAKPWPGDNYMAQQSTPPDTSSSQFSTNYSVVVAQVNKEAAEQKCHQKGGVDVSPSWSPDTNHPSDPKPSLCQGGSDLLSCAMTLVPNQYLQHRDVPTFILPTLWDTVEQLLLQPEPRASLANSEKQPLLLHPDKTLQGPLLSLDMVTTDSSEGLDSDTGREEQGTTYRPNSLLSECESSPDTPSSGYKQQWEAPLDLSSQDGLELSLYAPQKSWLKQQEEGDVKKGEVRGHEIFLGGWMI